MTERWTDTGRLMDPTDTPKNNVALVHPYFDGSDVASLVEFCPVV